MNEDKESALGRVSVPRALSQDAFSLPMETQSLVDYDGPHDPTNPKNWSPRYKWTLVVILFGLTLTVYV